MAYISWFNDFVFKNVMYEHYALDYDSVGSAFDPLINIAHCDQFFVGQ